MRIGIAIALGVSVGAAIFAVTGDGSWISLGAGLGAASGVALQMRKGKR